MEDLAARLLAGPDRDLVRAVRRKSVAISSGKGGVGKTITACNLAVYYARAGRRVGLVDLDPLSDVAALLDLQDAEKALQPAKPGTAKQESLAAYLLPAFTRLDILFPRQKLSAEERRSLAELVYTRLIREIAEAYDMLIFDMPAGMEVESNLAWLPFMHRLVVVTNPEPTAHASAGAYAREAQRLYPGIQILLWHNRFSGRLREGFHPSDVAGNYNRFVAAEERLTPRQCSLLRDLAFVPEDPALDLLHGEPSPVAHVLQCMHDSLDYAHGRLIAQAARRVGIPRRLLELVSAYVVSDPDIDDREAWLARLASHLSALATLAAGSSAATSSAATSSAAGPPSGPAGSSSAVFSGSTPFSAPERAALLDFLARVRGSAVRAHMLVLLELLSEQVRQLRESRRVFSSGLPVARDPGLEREVARFLVRIAKATRPTPLMRNQGVLLLFYFSLLKLLQSPTLLKVMRNLVPRRLDGRGRRVRDRLRQIRSLVEQDPDYRRRYLAALRTVHGLVMRQISSISDSLGLSQLVLRGENAAPDSRSYLKLLSAFMHETLYGGLSVIIGFDYRSTAIAFQAGAEKLLASLADPD
jgi:hypothetical protein